MRISQSLWQNLLNIKQQLKESVACNIIAISADALSFSNDAEAILQHNPKWHLLLCREPVTLPGFQAPQRLFNGRAWLCFAQNLTGELQQIYRHYTPLAASRFIFHRDSFLIAHAAQSLDGKMCTVNGASQWIGNDINLIHAHRIRALVDGIIVGANTMRNEHPKLSVRHVVGENPKRIVLCNSTEGFNEQDLQNTIVVCGEDTLVSGACGQDIGENSKDDRSFGAKQLIRVPCDACGRLNVTSIRQKLAQLGIHSVMLEGGPCTINQFIQQGGVDWLQVHIAPILFGSGKSIYECESIDCVADALHLNNSCFVQMGDAAMLSGEVPPGLGVGGNE